MRKLAIQPLVDAAHEQGWSVSHTPGGHIKFIAPDGAIVHGPSTPHGNKRSFENARAQLRRAGLKFHHKGTMR